MHGWMEAAARVGGGWRARFLPPHGAPALESVFAARGLSARARVLLGLKKPSAYVFLCVPSS